MPAVFAPGLASGLVVAVSGRLLTIVGVSDATSSEKVQPPAGDGVADWDDDWLRD